MLICGLNLYVVNLYAVLNSYVVVEIHMLFLMHMLFLIYLPLLIHVFSLHADLNLYVFKIDILFL